jgi:hypothetical protein
VSIVSAPETFERPVPRRLLNDWPLSMRLVVDAVANDPYVVDESAKRFTPVKKFVSERSVDDAAPASEVRNPASLLNQERLIEDDAIEFTRPPVPRYAKPWLRPILRFVVEALTNDE